MNYSRYNALLKHSCYIHAHKTTTDPLTGQVVETWDASTTAVPCLIQPLTGEQAVQEQGLELMADFKGFFKSDAAIDLRDKITFDGKTFLVVYKFEGWSGSTDHIEVNLKIEVATSGI